MIQWLIVGLAVAILVLISISQLFYAKKTNIKGRHILIVGGSSGIGLSTAEYALSLGAVVTIAARDVVKLERAAARICSKYPGSQQRLFTQSLNVATGYEAIKQGISEAESKAGPIYMLINCAGTAICGKLEDMSEKDVKWLTDLNFLGSLWATKIVLPSMKERGEGSIVLISTQAALLGVFGYSAYGATKWAVRGLGEALLSETIGTGVTITISFPPDTDTPGFEVEETSKPPETKIISGGGGLYSPDVVAKQMVDDAMNGKPYSSVGFEGWLLLTLYGIVAPGFISALIQSLLLGPLRIIALCYQYYFHYVIMKVRREKNTNKKAK